MCECKYCGKPFECTHASQKYCSSECATNANRENARKRQKDKYKEITCIYCGKKFSTANASRKYCSKECFDIVNDRKSPKIVEPKKITRKNMSLRKMALEAKKLGMTYGQYDTYLRRQSGEI